VCSSLIIRQPTSKVAIGLAACLSAPEQTCGAVSTIPIGRRSPVRETDKWRLELLSR
jgi:hypothetical protein